MATEPVIIATWKFGVPACQAGWERLASEASALDAIEAAANVTEEDPGVMSVGYGGLPNAEGVVELDAAIMDGRTHTAGSVAGITQIRKPISIARRVMEKTPHVMLVGQNARRFALQEGFPDAELLTEESRNRWLGWRDEQGRADVAHFEERPAVKKSTPDDHDTIGLCALDREGNLATGCTTSGMAWKLPGRVGDSPIIGSGLYVDNEAGAAAATGHGDEIMKACLCYRVVLLMEQGRTAQEACEEGLRYLLRKRPPEQHNNYGAGVIALRKDGQFGAAGTLSGFHAPDRLWNWAVASSADARLCEGTYVTLDSVVPSLSDSASPQ
ncbi:MAG TPA: N(4)-(beta-N-acetylglucosaminyl)-L-asparaginase [Chthonomonadaceae bacterium]|nr:N(4)-(beta-N-acetylglucosaminyl)-L-asparaginase [Chthonomonadaceae bacterium]